MYKKSLTIVMLLLASCSLYAQQEGKTEDRTEERANIPVYFRFDSDVVDPEYKDNTASMFAAKQLVIGSAIQVDSMVMVATASPEGKMEYNQSLAKRRAEAMQRFFSIAFPELSKNIRTSIKVYSWSDLAEEIANDENVPCKEEVQNVLRRYAGNPKLLPVLRLVCKGEAMRYLEENYLSKMRSAANCLMYYIPAPKAEPAPVIQKIIVERPDTTPRYINMDCRYPVFAFRTNLLVPLTNIGVIVPLGNRYSVAADWYTPWLFRKSDHKNCFQLQAANVEFRYWFGEKHTADPGNRMYRLTGHSLAAYIYGGKYDFEHDWSGHQGEFWSAGLDYTYAIPGWNNRIRWEFSMSMGYFRNQSYAYDVFTSGGKLYTRSADRKIFRYVGPTKIAVSLVVPINKHYTKTIKQEVR